jgi:hypothetical protein
MMFIDAFISPILSTYRFKSAEAQTRIATLEQRLEQAGRILELEAAIASFTAPHGN